MLQVMRGYNIVTEGWAGEYNTPPLHTHKTVRSNRDQLQIFLVADTQL